MAPDLGQLISDIELAIEYCSYFDFKGTIEISADYYKPKQKSLDDLLDEALGFVFLHLNLIDESLCKIKPAAISNQSLLSDIDVLQDENERYSALFEHQIQLVEKLIGEGKIKPEKTLETLDRLATPILRAFKEYYNTNGYPHKLRTLKSQLSRLGQVSPMQPKGIPPVSNRKNNSKLESPSVKKETLALALLAEHPDYSDIEIAKQVGIHRTSLYRMSKYTRAKEILRQDKGATPTGCKNEDGVDAW